MASAGANDAIQPTSCSSLDYGLWHAHDDPAGESSAPLKEFLPADLPYTVRQRSSDSVRFGELSRQRLTIKGPGKARELMLVSILRSTPPPRVSSLPQIHPDAPIASAVACFVQYVRNTGSPQNAAGPAAGQGVTLR